jgi:hypothetical protein
LELVLDVPDGSTAVANPFDPAQIDVRVRFTSPTGSDIRVPAFWYEHGQIKQWRVRFTPTQVGAWRAMAELRAPRGSVSVSGPIQFDVRPAPQDALPRGFVRVHARNPRYLALAEASGRQHTFLPIGVNLGWWKDDALQDYARWFDALKANGGNTARIWMSAWAFGLEWQDTGLGDYRNRMPRARLLDEVLGMAEQRGIYLIIVLLNHGAFSERANPEWQRNPYNAKLGGPCQTPAEFASNPTAKKLFKQRLRYIAARWAYSPNILAWEWWNEVDLTPINTALLKPWLQEMSAALQEYDPYDHLTTISYAGDGDPAIWGLPSIDLLQRHEYNAAEAKWFRPVTDLNLLQRIPTKIGKPFLFGEFGASTAGEGVDPVNRLGIQLHNGLWASVFNGYASTALYWWWDSLVEPANLWPHVRGLANFLRNEDMAVYKPMTATASVPQAVALALAKNDGALLWLRNRAYNYDLVHSRYLISLSTGEQFKFDLKPLTNVTVTLTGLHDGIYRVGWFDTLTGAKMREGQATSYAGKLVVVAPVFTSTLAAKLW